VRIVHYYRDLTRPSGVTAAIAAWQKAAMDAGVETTAFHNGEFGDWHLPGKEIAHFGRGRQGQIPILAQHLREGDLLVLHEGWVTSNLIAARTARLASVPYVVVPHGIYESPIRQDLKGEAFGRLAAERRYLTLARGVHVFHETEKELVLAVAPNAKPFVGPTGYEASSVGWTGGGGYLAWFGRYSVQHKGLDLLLHAYASIQPSERLPLRLRGVDYFGGKLETERLVSHLGLNDWVSVGHQIGDLEKAKFLSECEWFLFPSRWESHSIALLEALSMGVPVVLNSSIHIARRLKEVSAAKVIDFSVSQDLSRALAAIEERPDISRGATGYIRQDLAWPKIMATYVAAVGPRFPAL
jgi:glycosyltransferase involved in cell wall biosynthesis